MDAYDEMVELGLLLEQTLDVQHSDDAQAGFAAWAAQADGGWPYVYFGLVVWADRGCRLLDSVLPRELWLPHVTAGLDPSACRILSALLDALLDAADGQDIGEALAASSPEGGVSAHAVALPVGELPTAESVAGWQLARPAFVCASAVMRRARAAYGDSGEAFGAAHDLGPRS